jgi:hypothetical protein
VTDHSDIAATELRPRDLHPDRASHRAAWLARLLPLLTTEWQSAQQLADVLNEPRKRVLERMAEIVADGRAERRIVRADEPKSKKMRKRPRVHKARFVAQFRLRRVDSAAG